MDRVVYERFGGRCHYCGGVDVLRIDHKFPVSKGGGDELENLVLSCQGCNSSKRDRTDFAEFCEDVEADIIAFEVSLMGEA